MKIVMVCESLRRIRIQVGSPLQAVSVHCVYLYDPLMCCVGLCLLLW